MSTTATEPTPAAKFAPTTRDDVIEMIRRMPADATLEDIQYALYVRQKCDAGIADIEAGRVLTNDEVMQRLAKWLT